MDNSTAEAGFYAVAVFIALSENVSAVVVMLVESTFIGKKILQTLKKSNEEMIAQKQILGGTNSKASLDTLEL